MNIVEYKPNLFSSIFDEFYLPDFFNQTFNECKIPDINIINNENLYSIQVAIPGKSKENFSIKLDDNILSISLDDSKEIENTSNYSLKQFSYNSFLRTFKLPDDANLGKIKANYTNGVLNVELPKNKIKQKKTKEIIIS